MTSSRLQIQSVQLTADSSLLFQTQTLNRDPSLILAQQNKKPRVETVTCEELRAVLTLSPAAAW